jgi:transposase
VDLHRVRPPRPPTAGTIFHGSSTSLQLWFYAMYLVASTKTGISAKHLERELGVSYRAAWRMLNLIRNQLMVQDEEPLSGEVEADETAWGGRPRLGDIAPYMDPANPSAAMQAAQRWSQENKATVFAMVERGGRVRADVVPSRKAGTLHPIITKYVLPSSTVFTDEWSSYRGLGQRYEHHRIRHAEKVYVSGNVHTQTIEGFFSNLKRGIAGNYHSVSRRWLQSYLNEYAFRYNERHNSRAMFSTLVDRAAA